MWICWRPLRAAKPEISVVIHGQSLSGSRTRRQPRDYELITPLAGGINAMAVRLPIAKQSVVGWVQALKPQKAAAVTRI